MKAIALLAVIVAPLCAAAPAATLKIISPVAAGGCYGGGYFPMENAFDDQPTWDAGAGQPTGSLGGADAPYYDDRWGYVDFGADYADVRIEQGWTQYRTYSVGDQRGFTDGFWTDTNPVGYPGVVGNPGTAPDAVAENRVNFNSATGLDTGDTMPWYKDFDYTGSPIAPPRRYLLLHSDPDMTNRGEEFAFVGYLASEQVAPIPEPATLALLAAGGGALLLRRRT